MVSGAFLVPSSFLLWIEPATLPVFALALLHAWGVPAITARRGAASVVPLGSERSAERRSGADRGAEGIALGLLGDLVGHEERRLLADTGLALQRGELGTWLVGEQGAVLVRSPRRAECWCVRIREVEDLPAADRIAHLLLALREDEPGFAKVANMTYSGSVGRISRRLPGRSRPALRAAQREERRRGAGGSQPGTPEAAGLSAV